MAKDRGFINKHRGNLMLALFLKREVGCRGDWTDSDPATFRPLTDGAHRPCSSTRGWKLPMERGWVTE